MAYDCLQQVFILDADSPLKENLGLKKRDGRYYGPKEMLLVEQGLRWDNKLGWVVAAHLSRYEKGEYFDLQAKQWTTLAEANKIRGELANPWVITTEHLEIRGTAKLEDLVDAANRLEAFYAQIFASYSGFFAQDKGNLKLIFGMLDHPPLKINIAKDRDTYGKSLPAGVDMGWSAGMWIPSVGASFFYAGPKSVMYHEFTHQIFSVFGHQRGNVEPWIAEGIANYTETPVYQNQEMHLGILKESIDTQHHFRLKEQNKAMAVPKLLSLTHAEWSATKEPGIQYAAAGALAQFCMEANQRKYRADYVDLIRDAYSGNLAGRQLWDYLGLTKAEFFYAYETWECETAELLKKPVAK